MLCEHFVNDADEDSADSIHRDAPGEPLCKEDLCASSDEYFVDRGWSVIFLGLGLLRHWLGRARNARWCLGMAQVQ